MVLALRFFLLRELGISIQQIRPPVQLLPQPPPALHHQAFDTFRQRLGYAGLD